uniref:Uncharacterized protein n=1 Tax=Arundo donax TaxID=35708 RepID=A0A0A9BFX0_ARUDO
MLFFLLSLPYLICMYGWGRGPHWADEVTRRGADTIEHRWMCMLWTTPRLKFLF